MLQAKNESEHKTKEFLKNTISDISHQLKTPLAALEMYQEIMEAEPDNAETVKEFSKKDWNCPKTNGTAYFVYAENHTFRHWKYYF